MKYLYYLGSLLILIGALGKLQHWPYYNVFLLVGVLMCLPGIFSGRHSFFKRRQF